MLGQIDVRSIVRDHLDTLVKMSAEKRSSGDLALFYGVPLLVASVCGYLRITLDAAAVSILLTTLSIFTGLLLNLLLLVHGLIKKGVDNGIPEERHVLRKLYRNISYNILVAILALFPLLAIVIFPHHPIPAILASAITYFLVANFVLTLLMILKRVHVLLNSEFRRAG